LDKENRIYPLQRAINSIQLLDKENRVYPWKSS
jgi:hypothetical protein